MYIVHLDDFDQLGSQIPPSRTQNAADLFRNWVILKVDRKDRGPNCVITLATDEYHVAKSDHGLRIFRVEDDHAPQRGNLFVFDAR